MTVPWWIPIVTALLAGGAVWVAMSIRTRQLSAEAATLRDVGDRFRDAFHALSAEALRSNNQAFLDLARENLATFQVQARADLDARQTAIGTQLAPVSDTLGKVDTVLRAMEAERAAAYASLTQQVEGLRLAQLDLRAETSALARALRAPAARGQWGELHLRRVVEVSGMVKYCDFQEQEASGDGGRRADMIVRLPGDRTVVVDAKAPLSAYLDAMEASDEPAREKHLKRFSQNVRSRVDELSGKDYGEAFRSSIEEVVMFLPGESLFAAALQHDVHLVDYALERGVILASPMTLTSILRAASLGWRHAQLAENAQAISALGRELYDRVCTWTEHLSDMGDHMEKAVRSYNSGIGSLESRVMPKAREFAEMGVEGRKDLPELTVIDTAVRQTRLLEPDLTPSRIG